MYPIPLIPLIVIPLIKFVKYFINSSVISEVSNLKWITVFSTKSDDDNRVVLVTLDNKFLYCFYTVLLCVNNLFHCSLIANLISINSIFLAYNYYLLNTNLIKYGSFYLNLLILFYLIEFTFVYMFLLSLHWSSRYSYYKIFLFEVFFLLVYPSNRFMIRSSFKYLFSGSYNTCICWRTSSTIVCYIYDKMF